MFPFLQANLPTPLPNTASLFLLIGIEFLIGFFIGTITRVLMSALDVAGMIISTQSSLANAQLFNPAFSSQGSIVGTFLTLVAVLMLFATDLHHLLILAVANSYELFPFGKIPDAGSMSQSMVEIISKAFMIGVQLTAPFLLLVFLMYIAMAVMSKLMPQVQVFMIAIPLQIIISLIILAMVGSAMMLAWLHSYQKGLEGFLQAAGG
jgi:flagellar biosynthetic protein FliR